LTEAAKTLSGGRTPIPARMSGRSLRNARWGASHALRGAKRPPGASPCSRMSWPAMSKRNVWKRRRSRSGTRQTLRRRSGRRTAPLPQRGPARRAC